MRYLPCSCTVCQDHDQEELMNSPERVKLLAKHNLYISLQEINLVKQCIREGSLWELLETRCRSHPRMLDGFRKLGEKSQWLEGLDTTSKSTLFYLSSESASRPEVVRYSSRIERLTLSGDILITDDTKTSADGFDTVLHFKPPFGPYPAELAETYPFNAEVPAKADLSSMERALLNTKRLIDANPSARFSLRIKGLTPGGEYDQIL